MGVYSNSITTTISLKSYYCFEKISDPPDVECFKASFFMIERRNFYRILHAQPDASMAVIRENYRLLKQKLKTHPDLTNDDWNERKFTRSRLSNSIQIRLKVDL